MNLTDFRNISTEQLLAMARGLPGGRKVYLPDASPRSRSSSELGRQLSTDARTKMKSTK